MSFFYIKGREYYEKHGKRGCKGCKGKGITEYCVDQDETKSAPCIKCFPDDAGAQEAEIWWKRLKNPPKVQYISYYGQR